MSRVEEKIVRLFNPSDVGAVEQLARTCASVLIHGSRALWSEEKGMRMGRDTSRELFVALTDLADKLGILPDRMSGEAVSAFWRDLWADTGLEPHA
jgi:hypothetical protein